MIYPEYHSLLESYQEAMLILDDIIEEKEILFSKTQPAGVDYEKERVSGGNPQNVFDRYLIEKERKQIEERIEEARIIVEQRRFLLDCKTEELRRSCHLFDRVYRMRWVDNIPVKRIAANIGYSEMQTYRIVKRIKRNLQSVSKC